MKGSERSWESSEGDKSIAKGFVPDTLICHAHTMCRSCIHVCRAWFSRIDASSTSHWQHEARLHEWFRSFLTTKARGTFAPPVSANLPDFRNYRLLASRRA